MLSSGVRGVRHRRSSRSLTIAELTRPSDLERLRGEWTALLEASTAATPFQAPEWLVAWWHCLGGQGLWTLAIRRRGRLVGIAPLYIFADPQTAERRVCLAGNGVSDKLSTVSSAEDGGVVARAVLDHLARRAELWDTCDFRDLPADSAIVCADLPPALAGSVEAEEPCPVLTLPRTADDLLQTVPRALAQNLRRSTRRARERGEVVFETAAPDTRRELLAALFHLHAARWEARGQRGVLDERMRRFHETVSCALQERDMLYLHALRIDRRIIAAQYVLQYNRRAYLYITGFDPDFGALSPGALLMSHVLQEALRRGNNEFDFLRGRERYKYVWGAVDRPQRRLRIWKRNTL
jgi:CelD/BcsL family acetyltransferase involved in cellulose biosynthesis